MIHRLLLSTLAFLTLTHCAAYDLSKEWVKQGTPIPLTTLKQLHTGLTKEAVNDLLGTPLLNTPFSHDRWDYVYTVLKKGKRFHTARVTLYFHHNQLTRIIRKAH